MLDWLRSGWNRLTTAGAPSESDLAGQIQWAVDRRLGRADYMGLPSVSRARQLLITTVAQLEPVAYRNGFAMAEQPAVLRRPAVGSPRWEWLSQMVGSLIDEGDAFLWLPLSGRNAEGWPDVAQVLPAEDVEVEWAQRPITRRYRWNDRELVEGRDLLHIALGRRPGELRGHSPFDVNAEALDRILATELYAADWFDTGAVPDVALKFNGSLTDGEAAKVKAKWIENHRDHSPAVLGAGWDLSMTGADPASSQLLESRVRGDVEVARIFGIIPEWLLLVSIGASMAYQNVRDALDVLVRVTVQPTYLSPLEEWLSNLLPSSQVVRFSFGELFRLAEPERIATEGLALDKGIYTLPEVRRGHGLPDASAPTTPPALLPTGSATAEVRP